jgi:hypothetical protein
MIAFKSSLREILEDFCLLCARAGRGMAAASSEVVEGSAGLARAKKRAEREASIL